MAALPKFENRNSFHSVLHDLSKDDSPNVYVLNKTGKILIFTVNIPHGSPVAVICPLTWVPVDLALQVDKKILLESSEFRRSMGRKHLVWIPASRAQEIFSRDRNARIESERVNRFAFQAKDARLDGDVDENKVGITQNITGFTGDVVQGDQIVVSNDGSVPEAQVQGVGLGIIDLCSQRVDPITVYSELKMREKKLSTADLNYLMSNLPAKSRDSSVNKFIANKLSSALSSPRRRMNSIVRDDNSKRVNAKTLSRRDSLRLPPSARGEGPARDPFAEKRRAPPSVREGNSNGPAPDPFAAQTRLPPSARPTNLRGEQISQIIKGR